MWQERELVCREKGALSPFWIGSTLLLGSLLLEIYRDNAHPGMQTRESSEINLK
eukprot:UN09939